MIFYYLSSTGDYLFNPPSKNYPYVDLLKNPNYYIDNVFTIHQLVRTKIIGLSYIFVLLNYILPEIILENLKFLRFFYFIFFLMINFFSFIFLNIFFEKYFQKKIDICFIFLISLPFLLSPFNVELICLFFISITLNFLLNLNKNIYLYSFFVSFLSVFIFFLANTQVVFYLIFAYIFFEKYGLDFKKILFLIFFSFISLLIIYFSSNFFFEINILKLFFQRKSEIAAFYSFNNPVIGNLFHSLYFTILNIGPIFILFIFKIEKVFKNKFYLIILMLIILLITNFSFHISEGTRQFQNLYIVFIYAFIVFLDKIEIKLNTLEKLIMIILTNLYILAFHSSMPIIEFQFVSVNMATYLEHGLKIIINPPIPESTYSFDTLISNKILFLIYSLLAAVLHFINIKKKLQFRNQK
jgi:hypothetical protein